MKDFIKNLSYDELVCINSKLTHENNKLKDKLEEYQKQKNIDSFCARVNPPGKSYKELEDALALAENKRQTEIDELYETQVQPLEKKIKEYEKALALTQSMSTNDGIRIRELQTIIKDQQTIINYAAGYISACEQFRDKHPIDVQKWLFGGLNQ
jgi:protein subunit release factor A